jgi:signal transduction histidine kinase
MMANPAVNCGRSEDAAAWQADRSQDCNRALLVTERRVLEMVVRGRPLSEALDQLTRAIEALAPGMLASVLQLDPDGEHLRHGSGPSLPAAYRDAIDGAAIGPNIGSCGSAAYERRLVIAADIVNDLRWRRFKELALSNGLRACWSTPIFGTDGRVLGTFALYYREPRTPGPEELDLIQGAAHVASMVIERCQMDRQREAMIDDLARTVRFSEMFSGILGHDLRNPLTAIHTAATLIQRAPRAETAARSAARILSSATRMNRMIEQLLDFTRIRLGRGLPVEPAPADLGEICRYVADEIGGGAGNGTEVTVQGLGDSTGRWDRERLLQVISNLVGNAAQHGTPGGPIAIVFDGTESGWTTLVVTNGGEIPAVLLGVLFDPFRREVGGAAPAKHGLGLGLFISRHIVEAHGGTIEVASRDGTTAFTLRLPRGDALAAPVVTFQAAADR